MKVKLSFVRNATLLKSVIGNKNFNATAFVEIFVVVLSERHHFSWLLGCCLFYQKQVNKKDFSKWEKSNALNFSSICIDYWVYFDKIAVSGPSSCNFSCKIVVTLYRFATHLEHVQILVYFSPGVTQIAWSSVARLFHSHHFSVQRAQGHEECKGKWCVNYVFRSPPLFSANSSNKFGYEMLCWCVPTISK